MHVLCAPPAFILSQDQTLLFMVFIFHSFECYKSKLKCFIKLLNFLLFIELKTFKKFYFFGTDFLVLKSYRFGLFSKGFTVYFSMYFLFSLAVNDLYYTICFLKLQLFFNKLVGWTNSSTHTYMFFTWIFLISILDISSSGFL